MPSDVQRPSAREIAERINAECIDVAEMTFNVPKAAQLIVEHAAAEADAREALVREQTINVVRVSDDAATRAERIAFKAEVKDFAEREIREAEDAREALVRREIDGRRYGIGYGDGYRAGLEAAARSTIQKVCAWLREQEFIGEHVADAIEFWFRDDHSHEIRRETGECKFCLPPGALSESSGAGREEPSDG